MAKLVAFIDAILASPIFWGVVAFLALAIALSGKLSVSAAIIFLWAAWAMAVFGVYRAESVTKLDLTLRLLILLTAASGLAVGAVWLGRWVAAKDQSPTAAGLNTAGGAPPPHPNKITA